MNALWLALGTLTRVPVPMPSRIDARVAGWSLVLAPIGGTFLAALLLAPWWVLHRAEAAVSPFLVAVLTIGALAWLTRGIHLDGLADTADGLGSGKPADEALAIMKQSEIGPFGVVTVLFVLLVQIAALSQVMVTFDPVPGAALLAVALVVSRGLLVVLGTSQYPAARKDGLGQSVAGTVTGPLLLAGLGVMTALVAGVLVLAESQGLGTDILISIAVAAPIGLIAGLLRAMTARDRFGGVTGDVYGAAIEVAFTGVLVAAALGIAV